MKFRDDSDLRETRSVSKEARAVFEKELRAGSVVGVYCGGEGEVGHLHFWLAVCKSKGKTASSKVTYKALDEDPGWDIKKGVTVLNVRWLERTDEDNDQRLWRHGTDQTLSLDSILPYRITWEATSGGKNPLMRMSEEDEAACIALCQRVKVVKPAFELERFPKKK